MNKVQTTIDPPPAWMPEHQFEAQFCGSDYDNFIYIRPADSASLQRYTKFRLTMDQQYSKLATNQLPEDEIVPNTYVVLKEDNSFHRVKVTDKDHLGFVRCIKIDEGTCAVACPRQIFPLTDEFRSTTCFAIKCKLMGLDIFDGLPHLELGFRLIKMSEIFSCQFYVVDVQGSMNGIPYVQMTRCGTDLKDAIQKFIPILCEPSMPKLECPFRGEVFHVNSKACAWFRQYSDDALAYKIAQTLQRYQKLENSRKIQMKLFGLHDTNVDQCESESSSRSSSLASFHNSNNTISTSVSQEVKKQISWKGSIFVTQYEEDLYRVKVTRLLQRNKVEVEFIDFGNRDTVSKSQLIPASTIDENLNFIPAQCLRGRIAGFYKINVSQFWRLMPSRSQPAVNIVIKNMKGDEENGMEIEIFRLHAETSISETWRASSPESLVLAWYNLKPAEENSTGATGIRNVSQSRLALEGRNLDHIQNSLAHLNFEPCRH